jgi:Flp pilus assembly protein TadD
VARAKENPGDPAAVQEIVAVLNGGTPFGRTWACCALGEIGSPARRAIPDLIRALNCGDGFVEREAARALGPVSKDLPDAVPALMEKLSVNRADAAYFSAESLGVIGKPALIAIPVLDETTTSARGFQPIPEGALRALIKLRAIEAKTKTATSATHDELYTAGMALVQPYLPQADGLPQDAESDAGKADLTLGIEKLLAAAELEPSNWENRLDLAKACEAAGRTQESYGYFQRAYFINSSDIGVVREYVRSCVKTGRKGEGVRAAKEAVMLRPDDASRFTDLAQVLLVAGDLDEAYEAISRSSGMDPQNKTTVSLRQEIEDVMAGRKPAPTRWP